MNPERKVIVALVLLVTALRLSAQPPQLKVAAISAGAARLDNGSLVNIGQPFVGVMVATDGSAASASTGLLPTLVSDQTSTSPLVINPTLTMPNGQFQFSFPTQPGRNYVVQASTNLLDWTSIWTNIGSWTELLFTDTDAALYPLRFFRVVTP